MLILANIFSPLSKAVIDSQYQGNGIGTRLLKEIQESMNGYQFLTLTSVVGKDKFYEKQNWKRQTSAFIWPNSEKQKNDHAKRQLTRNKTVTPRTR